MSAQTSIAVALGGMAMLAMLLTPGVRRSRLLRASVTPLASIIGSGFLVIGPILLDGFGDYAPLAMLCLCLVAYVFGHAIRYNIGVLGGGHTDSAIVRHGESLASWALAFAYVISVCYYLNLFGAFATRAFDAPPPWLARAITTMAFFSILVIGWFKGFGMLERVEQISVALKLIVIAALLAGLAWFAINSAAPVPARHATEPVHGLGAIQLLFGLLVTVQGFETSRYLGKHYDAAERQTSMQLAQAIASAIYVIYLTLLTLQFAPGSAAMSETAVIDLMHFVSALLPALLVIGALSAQFSAAVADTGGAGGLIAELTCGRLSARTGYSLLTAIGLAITWSADVFTIISYASRAFALYYALQAGLAAARARARNDSRWRQAGYAALAALGALCAGFGTAVE